MNIEKQKTLIVKIGSSTITGGKNHLDLELLNSIASQIKKLNNDGWKIVIVSSGSVALGKPRIKNCDMDEILCKQRAAARGQPLLMSGWQTAFHPYNLEVDQLLFNKKNFDANIRVLKAIDDGIVIVNGDDTGNEPGIEKDVIYEDNDDLAADIAIALKADILVYLTDVDGVLDIHGKKVSEIDPDDDLSIKEIIFYGTNDKGTGGIRSKHKYASLAARRGVRAVIAKGKNQEILFKISQKENVGTEYKVNSK